MSSVAERTDAPLALADGVRLESVTEVRRGTIVGYRYRGAGPRGRARATPLARDNQRVDLNA